MAIIIPSKNIYGQIDNPKVIDNLVDNVTVNQTVITPDNEYEVSVHNQRFTQSLYASDGYSNSNVYSKTDDSGTIRGFWIGYTNIGIGYFDIAEIKIPKISGNKWISEIFYGKKKEQDAEENNIKYVVYYKKTVQNSTVDGNFSFAEEKLSSVQTITEGETIATQDGSGALTPPNSYEYNYTPETGIWSNINTNKVVVEYLYDNRENVGDTSIFSEDDDFYYLRSMKIIGYIKSHSFGDWQYKSISESFESWQEVRAITLKGQTQTLQAQQLEITVYGNTIGISLEDGTILYGSGNKPHSLSGNELMQDSARTDGVLTTKRLADNVLLQYENGKETATIMCGIADYYNQNTFVKATQVSNYFQLSEYGSRNAVSASVSDTHISLTETDNSLKATQENGVLRLKYSGVDKAISVTRNFKNLFGDVLVLPLPGGFVQNDNSFYIETNYEDPIENAMPNWSYDVNTKRHYTNISKSVSNYIVYADFDVYTVGGDEHNYSIDLDLSELPDGDYNVSYIYKVVNNVFHLQNFIVCAGSETPNDYPMVFNITDVVVPMIRSPYGADIPLSDNTDGSPKMFSVSSRNITYDGSVLQKLNLQELVTRMIKYAQGVVLKLSDYIGNKVNVNLSTPKNPSENVNLVVNNRNLILNMASRNWFGVVMTQTNGTYVLNGTCETSFNFEGYEFYLPAGTYTLSANNPATNNVGSNALCQVYSVSTALGISVADNVEYSKKTLKLKSASDYRLRIRCQQGVTYNNFIIKPQLELNEQSTEYIEPSRTVYAFDTDGKAENVQLKDTETVMFADNGAEIQTQYTMLKQN